MPRLLVAFLASSSLVASEKYGTNPYCFATLDGSCTTNDDCQVGEGEQRTTENKCCNSKCVDPSRLPALNVGDTCDDANPCLGLCAAR